jgi:hypothetical protein
VATAASVSQAIDLLGRWEPDVLVADIGMPGEDGYDFISKVRARFSDKRGQIPTISQAWKHLTLCKKYRKPALYSILSLTISFIQRSIWWKEMTRPLFLLEAQISRETAYSSISRSLTR